MTREEAILHIEKTKEFLTSPKICWSKYDDKIIALDIAIEALKAEPTLLFNTAQTYGKSSAIEQLAREQNTWLSQLFTGRRKQNERT